MVQPIEPIKREWLKTLREAKKLKTREIAEILGISFQHYNDIERGTRNPSIELSYKMAELFSVKVDLFLTERTKFRRSFEEIKETLQETLNGIEDKESDDN
jgi:transcriptional regulator with XRE-family HTH domain